MKILLLLSIILFSGCSLQKKSGNVETISIDDSQERDLSIDTGGSDDYGPNDIENSEVPRDISKKVINSLTVYSTLYSSLGLVSLLAESEKRQIPFSIITANGFASIISVLYAKKQSSNYLEWKLFDLLKRLKDKTPYSSNWMKEIKNFLNSEFGSMQLQQLKVLVLIPENTNKGVKLRSSGSIVAKVMQSLALENRNSFYQSPQDFTQQLETIGIDLNLSVAFLSDKSNFKYLSGYRWGLFTTYLSYLDKNSHLFKAINTPKELVLDAVSPLSDISSAFMFSIDKVLNDYQLKIDDWKSQNSTSSDSEI